MSDEAASAEQEAAKAPHSSSAVSTDFLASRMKCLYLSYPLQRAASNAESDHHKEWQGINFTYLGLKLIDCVIAKMAPGSTRGATRADVVQQLSESVLAFRRDADEEMIGKIIDFLIENLIGKDEFHQFQVVADCEAGLTSEPFRVRLIRRTWSEDLNAPVYTAEPQAIQLVLSMLDTPTMDAQKANMVILQEHVKRGRLGAALESAQRDALLTQRFEAEITGIIRAVQRDIGIIDYNAGVKPKLDEAHDHAKRVGVERDRIICDLADQQQRHLDREEAVPLEATQLKQQLEELQSYHIRLTATILRAGDSFLAEQNIQRFRVLAGIVVVNLAERALYPALGLPCDVLNTAWCEFAEPCLGPQIQRLVDHGLIIDKLIVDRGLEGTIEDDNEELADVEAVERELSPELENRFRRILLDSVDAREGTRLSQLLGIGREHQLSRKQLYLFALTMLRGLNGLCMREYHVENDGVELNDLELTGDDLIVYRSHRGADASPENALPENGGLRHARSN
jgi:hypothetical protein